MDIIKIINEVINEMALNDNVWYHGSEDARNINQNGFTERSSTTDYVSDPKRWNEIQNEMQIAKTSGNEDRYFELIKQVPALRKQLTYKKPIFFSNNRVVANSYSKDKPAFDYQNSEPKLFAVQINDSGNILKVNAHGESFRGIKSDIVKNALINAGIDETTVQEHFDMFPTHIRRGKMTAETLGIVAQQLGFDIVDVQGVLDSYNVGNTKSTIRMVFDPSRIKVLQ